MKEILGIRINMYSHNKRNKELGIRNKDFNLSDIGYTGIYGF